MSRLKRIAYFDCQFGAAGDMLLAALLDSGLDLELWQAEVRKIAIPKESFSVRISDVIRCGMKAKKIDILLQDGQEQPDYNPTFQAPEDGHAHKVGHGHGHEHGHEHGHSHETEHGHSHEHEHRQSHEQLLGNGHEPVRTLADILKIIELSQISPSSKNLASRIFTRLAGAEAKVHGVTTNEIHFHELGAIDAILDIIGFSIAYNLLEIEESFISSVPLGSGTIKASHGVIPIPAPAVVQLLSQVQGKTNGLLIPFECLTPTGAAILCEIATAWGSQASFAKLETNGSGAGNKNPKEWANVCRVLIGVSEESQKSERFNSELVGVIEANIDDQSPQALSYAVDRLWERGALDIALVPAQMKKGRLGQIISVVCKPGDITELQELILTETTTIGVRATLTTRLTAIRNFVSIQAGPDITVKVKIALDAHGKVVNVQPEFDDLAFFAQAEGISIKEAQQQIMSKYADFADCAYDSDSKEGTKRVRSV